jgi:hypothetical protein
MEEEILTFLTQINQELKNMRAKVSRILKDLDAFLFNDSFLADDTIEILMHGKPEKKLKGLLSLCGITSKFSNSLKNSSCTAIELIYKLITDSSNIHQVF